MSVSYLAAGGLCLWNDLLVPIAQDAVRVVSPCLDAVAKRNFDPVSKIEAAWSSSEQAVYFLMGCCGAYDVLMVQLSVPALRR